MLSLILFTSLISLGLCGDVSVLHSPPSLSFEKGGVLRLSDLDEVVASSMGYAIQGSGWHGLSVLNPFKTPLAAVVVGVGSKDVSFDKNIKSYSLKVDDNIDHVTKDLHAFVAHRTQRPVMFKDIQLDTLNTTGIKKLNDLRQLDSRNSVDSAFLNEMMALPSALDNAKIWSKALSGGQDFIYIKIESFVPLIQTYGKASLKVAEAKKLIRKQLSSFVENAKEVYDDRVVIYTVTADKFDTIKRNTRSLLAKTSDTEYNLATEFSPDYPAIFNIVLILSIILSVAILATSFSMAFMDPGRDSIIYRMTNPRMKKD